LRQCPVIQGSNALAMEMLEGERGDVEGDDPTSATASGAPLITRAFATTRSVIRVRTPCSISDIGLAIGVTELWLTQKWR